MKYRKISKLTSLLCLIPTIGICTYSLSSCNRELKIDSITLEADTDVLLPGNTLQINARIMPSNTIYNDLIWSISDYDLDGPFLTQKGLFVVPQNTVVANSTTITITATSPLNAEIKGEIEIVINPEIIQGFRGFSENKLTYVNKKRLDTTIGKFETKQVDIVQDPDDQYTFRTAEPIEWFSGLMEEATSPIGPCQFKFTPQFDSDVTIQNQQMKFNHTDPNKNEILTFLMYKEDTPTLTIPDANIGSPNGSIESITVTFTLDPRLKLIIDGYVYLDPQSQDTEQAVISYDKQPGDPHEIVNHGLGNYSTHLFCPSDKSRHIYRESMSTLYFHKKYFEYLDLDISIAPNEDLPQEIKDMLSYKYDVQQDVRLNDGFQYYKVYIYYTFDLDKMGDYDPAQDDFYSYKLFSVEAWDTNYVSPVFEAELECDIQWV